MADLYLRGGAASPNDIVLRDPTAADAVPAEPTTESNGRHYPYAPLFDRARLERINRRREEEMVLAGPFVPG